MTDKNDKKEKDLNKKNEDTKTDAECKAESGPYKMHKDSKIQDTATDVHYKTEYKKEDSNVAVPTKDAVDESKEWVDDQHKM